MVIVAYIMQSEIALRSTMSVILADQEDTGKSYVESQEMSRNPHMAVAGTEAHDPEDITCGHEESKAEASI